MTTNLLYVCWGNVNRSPAAEAITKKLASEAGLELHVESAGLEPPTRFGHEMLEALAFERFPLHNHAPKGLSEELLAKQDIVLCMAQEYLTIIQDYYKNAASRTLTLPEQAGFPNEEVTDPVDLITVNGSVFVPEMARPLWYRLQGRAWCKDREAVINAHRKVVKEIRNYVGLALNRMCEAGLIRASPIQPEVVELDVS